jgi:hypothetical protein
MRASSAPRMAFRPSVPAGSDHLSAVRVAVSVGVPSALLVMVDRPDLIMYAVFGAFTGMYGRDEPHQLRLIHQAQGALLLLIGVMVGSALSSLGAAPWTLVGLEAGLAGLGSLVADRLRLKPAGPFFGIFALGACASVPPTVPWWCLALVCTGSAGFSLLVGFAGWFRTRAWSRGALRRTVPWDPRATQVHALRYVLAVGIAGSAGLLFGIGHAYWAMAAAAVPLAADALKDRLRRGAHRVVGTIAGVGVTALILLPHPPVLVLALVVIALQFPTELFMARHYGIAQVFFTPLILIMTLLANPANPDRLIGDRAVETLLGATIGMAVAICIRSRETTRVGTDCQASRHSVVKAGEASEMGEHHERPANGEDPGSRAVWSSTGPFPEFQHPPASDTR